MLHYKVLVPGALDLTWNCSFLWQNLIKLRPLFIVLFQLFSMKVVLC